MLAQHHLKHRSPHLKRHGVDLDDYRRSHGEPTVVKFVYHRLTKPWSRDNQYCTAPVILYVCHFCSMPGATFASRSFSSPEADSGIIWPGINSMKFSLTWVVDQAQDLCQRLWEEIPEEGEGALGGDQEGKGHVPGSGECHFVSFMNSWHLKALVMLVIEDQVHGIWSVSGRLS